ncbi:hypothetical protein F5148DRAFT_511537 [Russula earlei]|uniref:Uncharacterized protein n=1 Tax=Russula earlei TaxID=71964 RepID=A0ACC0UGW6_9AGAM|nr:hypothetical protein F5148DRAFT_511537 [Russula earlei]
MPSVNQPRLLEVEDIEQRQSRLQDILERLNGESPSRESPNVSFDFGERRTFAMESPIELLARVRQFLPQIEQSNAELLQRDPRSIDVEQIEETDERVIEMELGLGVFEQRQARGRTISSSSSEASSFGSRTHSTRNPSSIPLASSSSYSEDDKNEDDSPLHLRSIHPLSKRADPIIQILTPEDEGGDSSSGDCLVP